MRSFSSILFLTCSSVMLVACGGGSGGGGSSDSYGLNGNWGGIGEDIDLNLSSLSVTVEDRAMTSFSINGVNTGQTATITSLDSDVFEYLTNTGVYGGVLRDPSNSYGIFVNEIWDFGVLQKGASAPFGSATIGDLDGTWSGTTIGFFGDSYYRYPAHGECASGVCVFTATGPAVGSAGNILEDVTGVQSTWNVVHRTGLVYDFQFQNTRGAQGFGAVIFSADKRFAGGYGCPPSGILEQCEFAAMVKH